MKFNFKKISAIATSVLMTGLTVGTAAAASFTDAFVGQGEASVGIVYGSSAANTDSIASGTIKEYLDSEMPTGSVVIDGESKLIEATGDELILGESLSDVIDGLDEGDLDSLLSTATLKDGDVEYDEEEEVDYTQEITLQADAIKFGALNDDEYVINTDLANDELPVLYLDQSSGAAYTLTVEFANEINTTAYDDSESITIFGKKLTFDQEMENGDTELVFFESTETVSLSMDDGEVTLENGDTIKIIGGTEDTANLKINGELYSVSEGDSEEGYYVSKVVTSDIGTEDVSVTLFAGANEWVLTDGNEVEVEGEDVDGAVVTFDGTLTALNGLTFTITPSDMDDDDLKYLEIGEEFVDPLFGTFKILFDGVNPELKSDSKGKITLEAGDTVNVDFVSRNGKAYDVSPFKLDGSDTYVNAGEDWFVGANYTGLEEDHIFIASEGTGKSEETLIYQVYKINDGDSTPSVEFKDLSDNSIVKVYETKELGDTGLYVSDITEDDDKFDLLDAADGDAVDVINNLITEDGVEIELTREATITVKAVDTTTNFTLNGVVFEAAEDDDTNSTTEFATALREDLVAAGYSATSDAAIITISGLEVDTIVDGDNMNHTIDTQITLEEDADDVFSLDSEVTPGTITVAVGVDTADDELEITPSVSSAIFTSVTNAETDIEYAVSKLGTYYEADDEEHSYLNIWTPKEGQAVYNVYFISTDAETSTEGTSGAKLYTDSDPTSYADKDLIIVGGSCINAAAANMLGVDFGTCGAEFTAATEVEAGQALIKSFEEDDGNMVYVVAGYNAEDTTKAVEYFLDHLDADYSNGETLEDLTEVTTGTA